MSTLRILCLTLILLGLPACVFGTDEKPPVAPPPVVEAAPKLAVDPAVERFFREAKPAAGIRIVPGDRISISVQGMEDLSVTRDVPPDGLVPVYRTDKTVNAKGKTAQELEKEIAAAYTQFEKPYVTVSVTATAPRNIYVAGAVKTPGVYSVTGTEQITVMKALALAGGTIPQSDLRGVTVQRVYPLTGATVASPPLDIQSVYDGDQRDNLVIEPDDTILVPDTQESRVQVLGHVEKPGSVVWSRGMTLSRAIAEAGGFKRFAKKDKINIVRRGRVGFVVNYEDVIDGRTPDPELEPRDVIFVYERWI